MEKAEIKDRKIREHYAQEKADKEAAQAKKEAMVKEFNERHPKLPQLWSYR